VTTIGANTAPQPRTAAGIVGKVNVVRRELAPSCAAGVGTYSFNSPEGSLRPTISTRPAQHMECALSRKELASLVQLHSCLPYGEMPQATQRSIVVGKSCHVDRTSDGLDNLYTLTTPVVAPCRECQKADWKAVHKKICLKPPKE
jgi:hypothetical protein